MTYDAIIVGAGASGFFVANALLQKRPESKVLILEKTDKTLQKVRISGGGRCNVTHQEMNQTVFSKNYPRGEKFLKNALRTFGAQEMIAWLETKSVPTKTEADGRMFPTSNTSQTIVDALESVLEHPNCYLQKKTGLTDFGTLPDGQIEVITTQKNFKTKALVLAAGSSKTLWKLLQTKQVKIAPAVPSLFTFSIDPHPLMELSGVSVPEAKLTIAGQKISHSGPLLITHKGFSGPAMLKLSAYGALALADLSYSCTLLINFTGIENPESVLALLKSESSSKKTLANGAMFGLPKRLWNKLLEKAEIPADLRFCDLSKKQFHKLNEELTQGSYCVKGKNTFKEEFVTAGGIELSQIDKKTCELMGLSNVYATGELLNIDGITGGFNFQSCWTTGYLVACAIASTLPEN